MRDSAPSAAAREVGTLADVMTLITLGDADVRMAVLVDVTVLQGEPRTITLRLPAGYEQTGISGGSLANIEQRDATAVLTLDDQPLRSYQFLVTLERAHAGGSFAIDTGFVTVADVQRERGDVAVEGVGTLELTAAERDGMHRIDVREINQALQSLARLPVLAAFRYQRATAAAPRLALDVRRFGDAGVLAAVADRAVATTLVTSEGRALTEVTLEVQNRAQPFLKVTLPPGATMVSVEVAGQTAKPVLGVDGARVPLLRPGFRPSGRYQVSFVYLHAGTPFARKGEIEMTLPKMDMPVGIVEWEVFVPDQYSARAIGGNAIDEQTLRRSASPARRTRRHEVEPSRGRVNVSIATNALPGQIRGRVTDSTGAHLPGVLIWFGTVRGEKSAMTGADGTFLVSAIAAGHVTMRADLLGFRSQSTTFDFDEQPRQVDFELDIAGLSETVTVTGQSAPVDRTVAPPSDNVVNLQRRTSGVLPVRVDVPRAGTSHQFVKPLVVDQETVVKLRYKRR